LALLLILLALLPSVFKFRSAVLSLITIKFTTSCQNYIFGTAGERGKVIG
jgi:hypothetical protein